MRYKIIASEKTSHQPVIEIIESKCVEDAEFNFVKNYPKFEIVETIQLSSSRVITNYQRVMTISSLQNILGCIILIISPFISFAKIPVIGTINIFGSGSNVGMLLIALGFISAISYYLKYYNVILITSTFSICAIYYEYLFAVFMGSRLGVNAFVLSLIKQNVANGVQFEVGLPIAGFGSLLLGISAIIAKTYYTE